MKKKIIFLILLLLPINIYTHTKSPDILLDELSVSSGKDYIRVLNELAYEYLAYDNAKSQLYAKEAIEKNINEDPQKLISLLIFGINEILLGYRERSDSLDQAKELYSRKFSSSKELEAYFYYFMGHALYGEKNYATSLEYFYKANIRFKELKNSVMENISLTSVSSLYISLGKYKSGLDILDEPYNYFKERGYWKYQILIMISRGQLKHYLGEIIEAEEIYREALNICKDNYPWMLPKVRNLIANYYLTVGNNKKSLNLYYEALTVRDKMPVIELGFTLSNISYILISNGEYDSALTYLKELQRLNLDNKSLEDFLNNALGNIYRVQKEYIKSEEYLEKARESISDDIYNWTVRNNYNYLVSLYFEQGDYRKALDIQTKHLQRFFDYTQSREYRDLISREEEISFDLKAMELEAIQELNLLKTRFLVLVISLLIILLFVIFIYLLKVRKDKILFEKLSKHDYLTNLYNRRTFLEKGELEVERYRRYRSTFSIVLIDIDNFKKFNDDYSHKCGDEVIKKVSALIKKVCRNIDVLARWGGEEFILLLPQTSAEGALVIGERLRKLVEESTFIYEDIKLNLTITLGVDEFKDNQSLDDTINRADIALLNGKSEGKNRVVLY